MIMAEEQSLLKAKSEFDQMVAAIRKAATEGQRIDLVERDLWHRMLAISRLMLQGFVDLQGPGDLGTTLEYEGRTLNRLEHLHDRRYVSVFGELLISRAVYGGLTRCRVGNRLSQSYRRRRYMEKNPVNENRHHRKRSPPKCRHQQSLNLPENCPQSSRTCSPPHYTAFGHLSQ